MLQSIPLEFGVIKMKITEIKPGYASGNRTSTYQFYVGRTLSPDERIKIKELSGKTGRGCKLKIQYTDGNELDWSIEEELMAYFDVEVSEVYNSWISKIAFDYDEELWQKLKPCEGRGEEDYGVDIEKRDNRIVVSFYYALNYNEAFYEFGEKLFDGLCDLFDNIRTEIMKGNLSAIYATSDFYGTETEAEWEYVESSENVQKLQHVLAW
jgi:hypothetical protein